MSVSLVLPQSHGVLAIFSKLPMDIINIILSYDNIIRYRNGRYINRIANIDSRKSLLEKIPMKYAFDWVDGDTISTVVMHIHETRYISINYKDYVISVATFIHSGIDYNNPRPGDADESTILKSVDNIEIV